MIRAYFLAANRLSSSLLAPVQTILPELKIKAVVLGSRILIITAAKRLGLYSAFLACKAILFKSRGHPRLTVDTMFCNWGTTPGSIVGGGAMFVLKCDAGAGMGLGGIGPGLATGA